MISYDIKSKLSNNLVKGVNAMAVTYFEAIPSLKGEKAKTFIDKMKHPIPIRLSGSDKTFIQDVIKHSYYDGSTSVTAK